jgi:hypothetical protein
LTSYVPPKVNTEYIVYIVLQKDGANVTNPTIADGDFTVTTDGNAFSNLDTLPTVTPAGGVGVKVTLSAAETNGANAMVAWHDPGDTWDDGWLAIQTSSTQIDGLNTSIQAAVGSYIAGPDIARRRGDSWSISITGLGTITGYTSLWFTIKVGSDDADTAAIVQIKKNASGTGDGLIYLKGAAGTAGQGSITIDDASAGNITIALDEAATLLLQPYPEYHYDIQVLVSGTVTTLTEAIFNITGDYTRAVT